MLVMIDGPMINGFIDDAETFGQCAEHRFQTLDTDGDGLLTRSNIHNIIHGSISLDDYEEPLSSPMQTSEKEHLMADEMIFTKFHVEGNGGIDKNKFTLMLMEILNAFARGIGGGLPVNFEVEEGSLLSDVYKHETMKIEVELLERKKKKEEAEEAAGATTLKDCAAANQSIKNSSHHDDAIKSTVDKDKNTNALKYDGRKLRKKRSKKLFGICACTGKIWGENETLD